MGQNSLSPIRFMTASATTSALGPNDGVVGDRFTEGGREYAVVYNAANSEIYPGYGVVPVTAATALSVSVSSVSHADAVVGVVRNATIATGYYGCVVTRGITPLELNATSGTVSVGDMVGVGTNGDFQAQTIATGYLNPSLGKFLEAGVSGASAYAYISCY